MDAGVGDHTTAPPARAVFARRSDITLESAPAEVIWDEPRDEPRQSAGTVNGSGVLVVS